MGGEEADLIISSAQSMRSLVYQGKIQAGSQTAICQTGIGVVVAAGVELSVTTVEDFKRRFSPRKQSFTRIRPVAEPPASMLPR
jgi:Ethanolamine utilization protein EutJ (predicted chaperonin)